MNQPTCFSVARTLSCVALLVVIVAWSCDSYDPDVAPKGEVSVGRTQFYALPNSSTVIDLKTLVKANSRVDLLIGKEPQQGSLKNLGDGLYTYMPREDRQSGRDYFMLALRQGGKTVRLDSVYIEIGADTTQIPCGVYAVEDAVSVPGNDLRTVMIDVLANDHICGVDTSDLVLSIYANAHLGRATIYGRHIAYSRWSMPGKDFFVYKVTSRTDTSIHAIGLVNLMVGDTCNGMTLRRDDVVVDLDTLQSNMMLVNVWDNDDMCIDITVATVTSPLYGSAEFVTPGIIRYTLPASHATSFTDSLTYQVCQRDTCKTARLTLTFKRGICASAARPDSVTILSGVASGVSLFVLNNDTFCGDIQSLSIDRAPKTGTASVQSDNSILYQPNNGMSPTDSVRYSLCGTSGGCSSAWVRINRR